jgi:hypothetical protein
MHIRLNGHLISLLVCQVADCAKGNMKYMASILFTAYYTVINLAVGQEFCGWCWRFLNYHANFLKCCYKEYDAMYTYILMQCTHIFWCNVHVYFCVFMNIVYFRNVVGLWCGKQLFSGIHFDCGSCRSIRLSIQTAVCGSSFMNPVEVACVQCGGMQFDCWGYLCPGKLLYEYSLIVELCPGKLLYE